MNVTAQTKLDNVEYCNASLTKDVVITLANLQQGVKVSGQSIIVMDGYPPPPPPPIKDGEYCTTKSDNTSLHTAGEGVGGVIG